MQSFATVFLNKAPILISAHFGLGDANEISVHFGLSPFMIFLVTNVQNGRIRYAFIVGFLCVTSRFSSLLVFLTSLTFFLPPANEVAGRLCFYTSLSVILLRGSLYDVTSCPAAWSHVLSRGLCQGDLTGAPPGRDPSDIDPLG